VFPCLFLFPVVGGSGSVFFTYWVGGTLRKRRSGQNIFSNWTSWAQNPSFYHFWVPSAFNYLVGAPTSSELFTACWFFEHIPSFFIWVPSALNDLFGALTSSERFTARWFFEHFLSFFPLWSECAIALTGLWLAVAFSMQAGASSQDIFWPYDFRSERVGRSVLSIALLGLW